MRAHEKHELQFGRFKDYVERHPKAFEKAITARRVLSFPERGEPWPKQYDAGTLLCKCEVISL